MSSPSETTTATTSAILAIPAANAVVAPSSDPPARKFPSPCWTHDETLALIKSYQDKWYSLGRRNLKTVDWESVADVLNRLCPDQLLPKTSAQCRHKMEKLRKRYRAEKLRITSNSYGLGYNDGKRCFSVGSSWVFYHLIHDMELGVGNDDDNHDNNRVLSSQNHEFDMRSTAHHNKFNVNNHQHQHRVGVGDFNDDFDDGDEGDGKRKYDEVFSSRMMSLNGCSSRKDNEGGLKGKERIVGEMVASIRMLGEGFVKMEKMKIEMMRDIEKMRMEMEMKRSEMILESQHLIVNAFVQGLKKRKKVKVAEIE